MSSHTTVPPQDTVFRKAGQIRAGWRILIFVGLVIGLYLAAGLILRIIAAGRSFKFEASSITPQALLVLEGLILFFTAIAALIMSRIEHRAWGTYGLPIRHAFRADFWIGGAIGFLAIGACLLCIFAFHGVRIAGPAIHGSLIFSSIAAWSIAFIVVGLAEEFCFRGYLQFTLTTGIGVWPAAFVLSALFALAHSRNPGESIFGLISVMFFGLLFCLFLRRRGNLWWAVGFHTGWDWGQTFFYGVPDSGLRPYHNLFSSYFAGPHWLTGGDVGPEASIFTPLILAVVAILFTRVYRQNRYTAI